MADPFLACPNCGSFQRIPFHFSEEVVRVAHEGDVFIVFTTSGWSLGRHTCPKCSNPLPRDVTVRELADQLQSPAWNAFIRRSSSP